MNVKPFAVIWINYEPTLYVCMHLLWIPSEENSKQKINLIFFQNRSWEEKNTVIVSYSEVKKKFSCYSYYNNLFFYTPCRPDNGSRYR